jgi:cobalt-zinc-cadmium resistance protein CzcA
MGWGGEIKHQQRARKRLDFILRISIMLIFIFLFQSFNRVKDAELILDYAPLGFIGAAFALLFTDIHLSVSTANFNKLHASGHSTEALVFRGTTQRLRTILMTTLLAMLGLLPMALSKGTGSEVERTLAVAIIGRLISAACLTLISLPILYAMFKGAEPSLGESI